MGGVSCSPIINNVWECWRTNEEAWCLHVWYYFYIVNKSERVLPRHCGIAGKLMRCLDQQLWRRNPLKDRLQPPNKAEQRKFTKSQVGLQLLACFPCERGNENPMRVWCESDWSDCDKTRDKRWSKDTFFFFAQWMGSNKCNDTCAWVDRMGCSLGGGMHFADCHQLMPERERESRLSWQLSLCLLQTSVAFLNGGVALCSSQTLSPSGTLSPWELSFPSSFHSLHDQRENAKLSLKANRLFRLLRWQ